MVVEDITAIEQKAHLLIGEHKYQDAGELYYQAAKVLQKEGKHDRAAICLAASASSLALIFGERTFHRIASLYEEAAEEAENSKDFEYASMLFKHAAIAYERDHDNNAFSECFYKSKEAYRKFLVFDLFQTQKKDENVEIKFNLKMIRRRIIPLFSITFASLLWGHGERPHRTVLFGFVLILLCAVLYTHGHFHKDNVIVNPNLFQATYFSFTNFTKVGAESLNPIGFNKAIAVIEAFSGIFIIPLFLTGLCRKYLRF
ncbi:MAG: two pore domain potassium channel family protein [Candidatus Omnitrophica bacterium]|nr:two pore domain potassium channel family protein [Candidatus Omnitrophota bacterium]